MELAASALESHKSLCTGGMGLMARLKMTVGIPLHPSVVLLPQGDHGFPDPHPQFLFKSCQFASLLPHGVVSMGLIWGHAKNAASLGVGYWQGGITVLRCFPLTPASCFLS